MGRAIVRDLHVFLFDEPLSNLDAKLRVQMRTEIKALHQRLKTTTIYVPHDQIEAMTTADKIVVMHDGVVEQIGAPLELYDRPANLFVASFIGSPAVNLIRGTPGQGRFLTEQGNQLDIPVTAGSAERRSLVLGIRPEHFEIDPSGVQAEVVVIEPMGSETQLTARIGGQTVAAIFRDRISAKPGRKSRSTFGRTWSMSSTVNLGAACHDVGEDGGGCHPCREPALCWPRCPGNPAAQTVLRSGMGGGPDVAACSTHSCLQ